MIKKYSILFLSLALTISFCKPKQSNKIEKTDKEKNHLNGKVKSVKGYAYNAVVKFGEIQKDKFIPYWGEDSFIYGYDEQGNIIERTSYDKDKKPTWTTKFKFNSLGKIVEEVSGINDTIESLILYSYNSDNNLIESKSFRPKDILKEIIKYKYNSDNKPVEEISYNGLGEISHRYEYKYDSNNLIEYTTYDESNEILSKTKSTYDNTNLIKSISYKSDGSANASYNYTYINGILETDKEFNSVNEILREHKYNQDGEMLENISYHYKSEQEPNVIYIGQPPFPYTEKWEFIYNKDNLKIAENHYYNNSKVETRKYEYEFDMNKNWTKRITFYGIKPDNIIEREITYYP